MKELAPRWPLKRGRLGRHQIALCMVLVDTHTHTCRLTFRGNRILYAILEYRPLLDSSNLSMEDWARMAQDVAIHYSKYHAFVVLHGTDTMAYTASALSFMLQNLGKPVILTGSQVSHHTHTPQTYSYARFQSSCTKTVQTSNWISREDSSCRLYTCLMWSSLYCTGTCFYTWFIHLNDLDSLVQNFWKLL